MCGRLECRGDVPHSTATARRIAISISSASRSPGLSIGLVGLAHSSAHSATKSSTNSGCPVGSCSYRSGEKEIGEWTAESLIFELAERSKCWSSKRAGLVASKVAKYCKIDKWSGRCEKWPYESNLLESNSKLECAGRWFGIWRQWTNHCYYWWRRRHYYSHDVHMSSSSFCVEKKQSTTWSIGCWDGHARGARCRRHEIASRRRSRLQRPYNAINFHNGPK